MEIDMQTYLRQIIMNDMHYVRKDLFDLVGNNSTIHAEEKNQFKM